MIKRMQQLAAALRALAEQDMQHAVEGDEVWVFDTTHGTVVITYGREDRKFLLRRAVGCEVGEKILHARGEAALSALAAMYLVPDSGDSN